MQRPPGPRPCRPPRTSRALRSGRRAKGDHSTGLEATARLRKAMSSSSRYAAVKCVARTPTVVEMRCLTLPASQLAESCSSDKRRGTTSAVPCSTPAASRMRRRLQNPSASPSLPATPKAQADAEHPHPHPLDLILFPFTNHPVRILQHTLPGRRSDCY